MYPFFRLPHSPANGVWYFAISRLRFQGWGSVISSWFFTGGLYEALYYCNPILPYFGDDPARRPFSVTNRRRQERADTMLWSDNFATLNPDFDFKAQGDELLLLSKIAKVISDDLAPAIIVQTPPVSVSLRDPTYRPGLQFDVVVNPKRTQFFQVARKLGALPGAREGGLVINFITKVNDKSSRRTDGEFRYAVYTETHQNHSANVHFPRVANSIFLAWIRIRIRVSFCMWVRRYEGQWRCVTSLSNCGRAYIHP
ncbi:hypothetical protein BC936DRAFT_142719 [Jimgerdemannia flammicorona]|uniref:Uncharacterized protein n=1 Tax=Jimgerdemannia flammicorona TaxID=994334 RepID=A0A433DMJ9_9FUNG|nr:hypothetical protein BC936DRAFT_142719 [Jimgerdemannia flammicorona]